MGEMNLMPNIKVTKVKAGQGSAGTEVLSDVVDMANWDGVAFLTSIATANAGNYVKAQQGALPAMGDAADLEGTKVVPTADAMGVWLDIYRPRERYLRVSIIRAGAATATGDIWALQYKGRKLPQSNLTTDVLIGKAHASPAEGTA